MNSFMFNNLQWLLFVSVLICTVTLFFKPNNNVRSMIIFRTHPLSTILFILLLLYVPLDTNVVTVVLTMVFGLSNFMIGTLTGNANHWTTKVIFQIGPIYTGLLLIFTSLYNLGVFEGL